MANAPLIAQRLALKVPQFAVFGRAHQSRWRPAVQRGFFQQTAAMATAPLSNNFAIQKGLVEEAEVFVKKSMASYDSSHDWWHVERVRKTAIALAREEGLSPTSIEIVELAAILHDVEDHKYVSCGAVQKGAVSAFLQQQGCGDELCQMVTNIIDRMGFKEELGGAMKQDIFPELAVVQDADRLDAIGAIGVARCLTFGGSRNRVLYDPDVPPRTELTKEQYAKGSERSTTINHFYEKLLKLKGLMKTEAGRRRADARHKFMEDFLEQFHGEWEGQK
eukprot:TRINITY_DN23562_c0_g1_i1.p1 TRINITY_DN23562_c0_g1~~TRINITY_DN23562_c0_g1_i1.p1  ORF type:complete len:277 (+),score=65.39 TRINITY_DN23562_c0_g1_i1:64-894(+)